MGEIRLSFLGTLGPRPGGAQTAGDNGKREKGKPERSTGKAFEPVPGHERSFGTLFEAAGKRILLDQGPDLADAEADAVLLTTGTPHAAGGAREGKPTYAPRGVKGILKDSKAEINEVARTADIEGTKVTFHRVQGSILVPWHAVEIEASGLRVLYAPRIWDFGVNKDRVLRMIDVYVGDATALTRDVRRNVNGKIIGHASMQRQIKWAGKAKIPVVIFTNVGAEVIEMGSDEAQKRLQEMAGTGGPKVRIARDGSTFTFRGPGRVEEKTEMEIGASLRDWNPSRLSDDELLADWEAIARRYALHLSDVPLREPIDETINAARIAAAEFAARTHLVMSVGISWSPMWLLARDSLRWCAAGALTLPHSFFGFYDGHFGAEENKGFILSEQGVDPSVPWLVCSEHPESDTECGGVLLLGEPKTVEGAELQAALDAHGITSEESEIRFPGLKSLVKQDVRTWLWLDERSDAVKIVAMENLAGIQRCDMFDGEEG